MENQTALILGTSILAVLLFSFIAIAIDNLIRKKRDKISMDLLDLENTAIDVVLDSSYASLEVILSHVVEYEDTLISKALNDLIVNKLLYLNVYQGTAYFTYVGKN